MGFMDKAKKLAEQAQEKLDEAQKNFNKSQDATGASPRGRRPLRRARPADPGGDARPLRTAAAERPHPRRTGSGPRLPSADKPAGGANASPDPFKPIQ